MALSVLSVYTVHDDAIKYKNENMASNNILPGNLLWMRYDCIKRPLSGSVWYKVPLFTFYYTVVAVVLSGYVRNNKKQQKI